MCHGESMGGGGRGVGTRLFKKNTLTRSFLKKETRRHVRRHCLDSTEFISTVFCPQLCIKAMIIDPPKQPSMVSRSTSSLHPFTNSLSKTTQLPQDSPPAYDDAAGASGSNSTSLLSNRNRTQRGIDYNSQASDAKPYQPQLVQVHTGLVHTVQQPGLTPSPVIYNYVNPVTGEQVASLLPPDHPEMICLQAGMHEPQSQFGLLGESQQHLSSCPHFVTRF